MGIGLRLVKMCPTVHETNNIIDEPLGSSCHLGNVYTLIPGERGKSNQHPKSNVALIFFSDVGSMTQRGEENLIYTPDEMRMT